MESYRYTLIKQYGIKTFLSLFLLVVVLLIALVFTACGAKSTTTSPLETTTSKTASPSQTTATPTYSKYTTLTTLNEEFAITIGAAFADYNWEVEYEKTRLEQTVESTFAENQQAEINPFNNTGSETFFFKALKTGKTQIILVHRPVTDQGSLDYAEMSLWQEIFTIIVE